jgi:hypothetical protein
VYEGDQIRAEQVKRVKEVIGLEEMKIDDSSLDDKVEK